MRATWTWWCGAVGLFLAWALVPARWDPSGLGRHARDLAREAEGIDGQVEEAAHRAVLLRPIVDDLVAGRCSLAEAVRRYRHDRPPSEWHLKALQGLFECQSGDACVARSLLANADATAERDGLPDRPAINERLRQEFRSLYPDESDGSPPPGATVANSK
jgi:hypothetical protein